MKPNNLSFTHPTPIIFTLCLLAALLSPAKSDAFSCVKVFRNQYSMFLFKSPGLMINETPMTMQVMHHSMTGVLRFNMCMDSKLEDDQGQGESMTAKFIFVNKEQKVGEPQYILFVEDQEDSWGFSTFEASTDSVNLPGVRALNPALKMIMVGAKNSFIDNHVSQLENHLEDQIDDIQDKINQFVKADIFVHKDSPSKSQKLRLLGRKKGDSQNNSSEVEQKVKTQLVNMMTHNNSGDSLGFERQATLTVPTKKFNKDDLFRGESHPQGKKMSEDLKAQLLIKLQNEFPGLKNNLDVDSSEENSQINQSQKPQIKKRLLSQTNAFLNTAMDIMELNTVQGEVNFYCDSSNPKVMSHYLPNQKKLEINVYSGDGCVVNFEFLQILNEIPWLTGSIFLILGIGLAFFGLKVYKNLLMIFIPMMIAILGFYLYFALVENSTTSTTKILTLVGLLVFIFALAVLMVWFNWLIYMIVAFGVSCQFGLLTHAFLEQRVEFFQGAYTEWILIVAFFVIFFGMYFFIKDYFLILATAIMGSTFVALSLKYLGLTDFDLLFDTQLDKLVEFEKLESSVQMVAIVFVCSVVVGFIVQVILLKRQQKEEEEKAKPTHDLHETHKNIQLENI